MDEWGGLQNPWDFAVPTVGSNPSDCATIMDPSKAAHDLATYVLAIAAQGGCPSNDNFDKAVALSKTIHETMPRTYLERDGNRLVAVTMVLQRADGKFLVVYPPRYGGGIPSFPGGGVERGEPLARAVIRETLEETGIGVQHPAWFHREDAEDYTVHYFGAFYDGTETETPGDAGAVGWVDPDKLTVPHLLQDLNERALSKFLSNPLLVAKTEHDLVYYDGPILSVQRNRVTGVPYLVQWHDETPTHHVWLVVETTDAVIAKLSAGDIGLREAMLSVSIWGLLLECDGSTWGNRTVVELTNDVLPAADLFLPRSQWHK